MKRYLVTIGYHAEESVTDNTYEVVSNNARHAAVKAYGIHLDKHVRSVEGMIGDESNYIVSAHVAELTGKREKESFRVGISAARCSS